MKKMRKTNVKVDMSMLTRIAVESNNMEEYARRVEAWQSAENEKYRPSDTFLARFWHRRYAQSQAHCYSLIQAARKLRETGAKKLWDKMVAMVNAEVES